MFGLFKIKALLIGMLLASPPVAAWMWRGAEPATKITETPAVPAIESPTAVQIPVEVVAKGSASQWVYVEVPSQAIPEPGVASWMALASLMLLRRQRPIVK